MKEPKSNELIPYTGGLCEERAAAARVERKIEALNEALTDARALGITSVVVQQNGVVTAYQTLPL